MSRNIRKVPAAGLDELGTGGSQTPAFVPLHPTIDRALPDSAVSIAGYIPDEFELYFRCVTRAFQMVFHQLLYVLCFARETAEKTKIKELHFIFRPEVMFDVISKIHNFKSNIV